MGRYRCTRCPGSPYPPRRLRDRTLVCAYCGGAMRKASPRWRGAAIAFSMILGGVSLASIPDLFQTATNLQVRRPTLPAPLLERFEPPLEAQEKPTALLNSTLLAQLKSADQQWIPRAETLPGGGVRYLYKRRLGEPELSIAEIQYRMENPPDHRRERQAIVELLTVLEQAKVRLVMEPPIRLGAAGEWDHSRRTLRIQPDVVEKGTVEFATVLNHEAIHVAQSCAAGSIRDQPAPLGLPDIIDPELEEHIQDPVYAGASAMEISLEREAYANQEIVGIGADLVRAHCDVNAERNSTA